MAEGGLDSFREQFLTCSICLEEFKQPRQLPCLHVFCHECLQETAASGQRRGWPAPRTPMVTCPLCKKEHPIPPEGVSAFPHDFRTQSLLDLKLNGGMLSPTSPSSPSGAVYPSLHQIPTAPPIDIHGGVANQATQRALEQKMRDHRAQLDREKTKLAKMSAGLQVINITYDAVFQCIDQRENKLYDQVKRTAAKLKECTGNELTASKRKLQENVDSLQAKIVKMEEEEGIARAVLESNSETQMQQFRATSPLGTFHDSPGVPAGLDTWMAPNLLFKSNLVQDEEIEQYLSPAMGSLCTIEKSEMGGNQGPGSPVQLSTDLTRPVFPFPVTKATRVVQLRRTAGWRTTQFLSGLGVIGDNLLLCHYHDMSLSECDRSTGTAQWKSKRDDGAGGGFFKLLTSLVSTSQPSNACAVKVDGTEYVAVSYPHQYLIKLYKSEQGHWHREVKEHWVAYTANDVKPDQMCCAGDEMVFLEYGGPSVQMGMYRRKLHVLNTSALPFQYVHSFDPGVGVESFCVLPSSAYNRLFYCVAGANVVAVDRFGNSFWSVNDIKAKAICADARGHLYVTSSIEFNPILHVLWHDGTKLQSFRKSELDITSNHLPMVALSQITFDHEKKQLIITDGQQCVCVIQISYVTVAENSSTWHVRSSTQLSPSVY